MPYIKNAGIQKFLEKQATAQAVLFAVVMLDIFLLSATKISPRRNY